MPVSGRPPLPAVLSTQPVGWVTMPIPDLQRDKGYLPPGEHPATLDEIEMKYVTNRRRREIFDGLAHVIQQLVGHGVHDIWINGSFVTDRQRPNDVDVIFVPTTAYGPNWGLLHLSRRTDLKKYMRVDLLPSTACGVMRTGQRVPVLDYFKTSRNGELKGIIKLHQPGVTP
jgi:hypothetical protein